MKAKLKQPVIDESGNLFEAKVYEEAEILRLPKLAYDLGIVEIIEEKKENEKPVVKIKQEQKETKEIKEKE